MKGHSFTKTYIFVVFIRAIHVKYKGTKYLSVIVSYLVFGLMVIAKPLLILYVGEDYGDLSIWLMLWSLAMLSYHNGALAALVLSGSNIRPLAYYSAFSASISLRPKFAQNGY